MSANQIGSPCIVDFAINWTVDNYTYLPAVIATSGDYSPRDSNDIWYLLLKPAKCVDDAHKGYHTVIEFEPFLKSRGDGIPGELVAKIVARVENIGYPIKAFEKTFSPIGLQEECELDSPLSFIGSGKVNTLNIKCQIVYRPTDL